jgi:DNA-binding response OmpR family regulator
VGANTALSGIEESHLSLSAEEDRPLLLIVDRDRSLAEKLIAEASTWGFRAEVASNLATARDQILLKSPDVVLLDSAISMTMAESLLLLSELKKQVPPIPVVILTEHDNLAQRLDFVHLGGTTYLQKSALPSQVLETVNQVFRQAEQAKGKVMVVDDDSQLLAIVRSLLEPWGLKNKEC